MMKHHVLEPSNWYLEFQHGHTSLSDKSRERRPKTEDNIAAVKQLIIEDRHVTYREIEASLSISGTTVHKILHEALSVRKLVSRWIPHSLTEDHKATRVRCQV